MDFSNDESDIPDLLEFLRPSVNKFCGSVLQFPKNRFTECDKQLHQSETAPNIIVTIQKSSKISSLGTISDAGYKNCRLLSEATVNSNVTSSILCICSNNSTRTITTRPPPAGDLSFLAITGLLPGKDTQSVRRQCRMERHISNKSVTTVPIKKVQPVVRTIFTPKYRAPKIRRVASTKIHAITVKSPETQRNCNPKLSETPRTNNHAAYRTLKTQTDIISHEARRVFVRKVRKICPGSCKPPADSNVFILLTDAIGERVFAVNTKTARKKRNVRQPSLVMGDVRLKHNCHSDKLDKFEKGKCSIKNKIKRQFSKNSIKCKDQSLTADSTDNIVSNSNLLMLNASTQTTGKYLSCKLRYVRQAENNKPEKKSASKEAKNTKPTVSHVRLTGTLSKTSDGIVLHYKTMLQDNTSNPESKDGTTIMRDFEGDNEKVAEHIHFVDSTKTAQKTDKHGVNQVKPIAERNDLSIQTDYETGSDIDYPIAALVQSRMVTISTQANLNVASPKRREDKDSKQFDVDDSKAVLRNLSDKLVSSENIATKCHFSNAQPIKKRLGEKSNILISFIANGQRKTPIENRIKGTQVSDTFLDRQDNLEILPKDPGITHKLTNTNINKTKAKVTLKEDAKAKTNDIAIYSNRTLSNRSDLSNQKENNKLKTDSTPMSNVKINIDANKECYNVCIQHKDDKNENVTIRTIMKNKPQNGLTKEYNDYSDDSGVTRYIKSMSMKNFLQDPLERENVSNPSLRRSFSNTMVIGDEVLESSDESINSSCSFGKQTDSLELAHRRESIHFQPTTAVYHTTVVLGSNAPGRHYRGDDCTLKDPVERDREIRRLLGVDRRFRPTGSKSQPSWPSQLNVDWETHDQKSRKNSSLCSQRLGTSKNYVKTKIYKCKKFQCQLCCTKRTRTTPQTQYSSVATQYCSVPAENKNQNQTATKALEGPAYLPTLDYKPSKLNVCKHRAIRISQSEYEMLKKSVHGTLMKRTSDYPKIKRVVSFKNTKKKSLYTMKSKQQLTATAVNYLKADYDIINGFNYPGFRTDTNYSLCRSCNIRTHTALYHLNVETQTFANIGELGHLCSLCRLDRMRKNLIICNTDCTVMTLQRHRRIRHRNTSLMMKTPLPISRRNAISSIELHESNFGCKLVTYSLSNMKTVQSAVRAARIDSLLTQNEWAQSTLTLYKGKKDGTRFSPNFGTSTFTLCSKKDSRVFNDMQQPIDPGAINKNKSFFKKLVMFLHKKPSKDVACQPEDDRLLWSEPRQIETLDSSIDSYHINTSFEEFEISSSIYDTSASNFSQHTIIPVELRKEKPRKSIVKKMKSYLKKTSN